MLKKPILCFLIETNFKLNIKFKILINVKYILSILLSRNDNVPFYKFGCKVGISKTKDPFIKIYF